MTLPKPAVLIAKYHPLSQSFSSTLKWVTAAFFQAKQKFWEGHWRNIFSLESHGPTILKIWWSRVDLKFCGIRIMSVKCLNCLIWLKEFSQIRGKFQKWYIPNISDSNIRQSLSSSNIWIAFWNAFAK